MKYKEIKISVIDTSENVSELKRLADEYSSEHAKLMEKKGKALVNLNMIREWLRVTYQALADVSGKDPGCLNLAIECCGVRVINNKFTYGKTYFPLTKEIQDVDVNDNSLSNLFCHWKSIKENLEEKVENQYKYAASNIKSKIAAVKLRAAAIDDFEF